MLGARRGPSTRDSSNNIIQCVDHPQQTHPESASPSLFARPQQHEGLRQPLAEALLVTKNNRDPRDVIKRILGPHVEMINGFERIMVI